MASWLYLLPPPVAAGRALLAWMPPSHNRAWGVQCQDTRPEAAHGALLVSEPVAGAEHVRSKIGRGGWQLRLCATCGLNEIRSLSPTAKRRQVSVPPKFRSRGSQTRTARCASCSGVLLSRAAAAQAQTQSSVRVVNIDDHTLQKDCAQRGGCAERGASDSTPNTRLVTSGAPRHQSP